MNTEQEEKKENVILPCPLCRKEFSIPRQGLDELPNNFFINNIVELEKSSFGQTKNKAVDAKCEEIVDPSEDYRNQLSARIPELRKALRKGKSKIEELKIMEEGIKRESVDNENKIKERCNDLRKSMNAKQSERKSRERL